MQVRAIGILNEKVIIRRQALWIYLCRQVWYTFKLKQIQYDALNAMIGEWLSKDTFLLFIPKILSLSATLTDKLLQNSDHEMPKIANSNWHGPSVYELNSNNIDYIY